MGSSDLSDLALEDFSEVPIHPCGCLMFDAFGYSTSKTNMQPQSEPLVEEITFWEASFQIPCFRGVRFQE